MSGNNSIAILVVDDDQGVRDMLSAFLVDQGYEITISGDGVEALEEIGSSQFDMVISDLRMPKVDGLEVIQSYKEKQPDGIGIIITGLATVESAVDALRLGVDDFVLKPFNLAHLDDIIRKFLEIRRIKAENKRLQEEIRQERDELKRTVTALEIIKDIAVKMNYNFSFSELVLLVMRHISRVVNYDYAIFTDMQQKVIFAYSKNPINKVQKTELARIAANTLQSDFQLGEEIKQYKFISDKPADHDNTLPAIQSTVTMELSSEAEQLGVIIALGTDTSQFAGVEQGFLKQLSTDVTRIFTQFWNLLNEQKHRIQLLVDNLSDGVVLIDVFAEEIVFNPAAASIFELHSAAFTIDSFLDTIGIDMETIQANCFRQDEIYQQLVDLELDGKKVVLDVQVKGFKYAGYMEEGIVFSIRDITERSQVEKMKANLIANVSHELKTPIAIIKEYLSLLEDGIGGELNAQQQEFITISQSHLNRLDRLIYNFLNMSKLDTGRLYIKPTEQDVNALIEETLIPLQHRISQKHLVIDKQYAGDLEQTQIDRDAFVQVMMNLLDNAIKYSPDQGTITITTEESDSTITIGVADQGKGIKQENIDKVFERFFQEMWDENKPPGTGLGLAITRQLVEEHGGEIRVESPDGAGAHFIFTLPVIKK